MRESDPSRVKSTLGQTLWGFRHEAEVARATLHALSWVWQAVTSLEIACKVTWPPHMGATNLSGLKYMPLICPTEKYNGKISSVISVDLLTLSGSSFFWHPRPSHHNSPIGHGCLLPVLAWSWPVTSGQWQVVFILSMIWPRPGMVPCLPYLQTGGRQYCLKWPSFLYDYLYFTLTLSASSTSSLTSQ